MSIQESRNVRPFFQISYAFEQTNITKSPTADLNRSSEQKCKNQALKFFAIRSFTFPGFTISDRSTQSHSVSESSICIKHAAESVLENIQQQGRGLRASIDRCGNVTYVPSGTNHPLESHMQQWSHDFDRSNEEPNPYSPAGPYLQSQMNSINRTANEDPVKSGRDEILHSMDNSAETHSCKADPLSVNHSAVNPSDNRRSLNALDLGLDICEAVMDARSGNWVGAADKSLDIARDVIDVSRNVGEAFIESQTNAVSGGYTQYSDVGFQ